MLKQRIRRTQMHSILKKRIHERRIAKSLEARHFEGCSSGEEGLRTSANRQCFATTQSAQTSGRCKRTGAEHVRRFQMWSVVHASPGKATSSEPPWNDAATTRLVQAKSPHVIADVSDRWCTEVRGALCVAWDLRETDKHSVLVSLAGGDTYRYAFDDSESHAKGCDS